MRNLSAFTCVFFLGLAASMPTMACSNDEMAADVKQIGIAHGDDFDQKPIFACFLEHAPEAAGLLVKELHPVPAPTIRGDLTAKYPQTMHVIWALRSLYYMTGMIFAGDSPEALEKMKLDPERENMLLHDESGLKDHVNIFRIWESRGTLYIAPESVQTEVIGKWQAWYAKDGASFQYSAHEHPGMWFEGFRYLHPPT